MASNATVIVPAAGLSQRFVDAGYKTLKPMIQFEYNGQHATMLQHAVRSAAGTKRDVIVGVSMEMVGNCSSVWPTYQQITVGRTRGQADTLYQVLSFVEGPVLIINSDAALHVPQDIWGQTGLPLETLCFYANHLGPKRQYDVSPYSHVDEVPIFELMSEKIWLSPYACAGAWWYHDATELRTLLKISLGQEPSKNGEHYLSTALNGTRGYAHVLNKDQYHSWNTPEDLESDPDVTNIRKE